MANKIRKNFSIPNSNRKIKTPVGPIDPKGIPNANKSLNGVNAKKGANPENLDKISTYLLTLLQACRTQKIGDKVIISLIDHTMGIIANQGKKFIPMVHSNENIGSLNDKSFITRTNCHLGFRGGGRLKKAREGAFHGTNHILLEDSERDRIDHKYRQQLIGKSGFNQKAYDIFLNDTYVSIKDLQNLCNWEEHKAEIEEEKNNFAKLFDVLDESADQVLGKLTKAGKEKAKKHLKETVDKFLNDSDSTNTTKVENARMKTLKDSSRGVAKRYAAITKTVTKLKIRNTFPVYSAHVVIHLCQTKNGMQPEAPNRLFQGLINQFQSKGIRKDRIYDFDPPKRKGEYRFKAHIDTALNVRMERTEMFQDYFRVVKSWRRVLTEHSQWYLELHEHLGDGILLNHFNNINDIYKDAPMSYFFVIEYFGDPRASITRNKDSDVFMGYSPTCLSYRFKQEVHYITNQNEPDKPIVLKFPVKDGDFETSELQDDFYPTREDAFHVLNNNIALPNDPAGKKEKVEKQYTLNFSTDVLNTNAVSELLHSLADYNIDPSILQNITQDDLEFNYTKMEDDEEHHDPPEEGDDDGDETNLRKVRP